MELFSDALLLARIQFAVTALYHYLFVPLSIGFGMILAILQTKAYKTKDEHDKLLAKFWLKLFTGTFAVGVATGITMEFSFGTNWADYSRFVGDIFGAPLAAEALLAFFLESVFLGVLIFGEKKVSAKFYLVSSWLVWLGSCLSALWILIANSWMQTPAGYEVTTAADGSTTAVLTDFFEAAFNYSTGQRYLHVIMALLITGALVSIAIAAYYKLKNREAAASKKLLGAGLVAGLIATALMFPAAHLQAMEVAENNPEKLAAMEGQYETGAMGLALIGWVDEENETLYSISIPGVTSFLASFDFTTEYLGLNDFEEGTTPEAVNAIFIFYHIMIALIGVIIVVLLLAFLIHKGKLANKKWPLYVMMFGWIAPLLAIESGWLVAELGRQPWIVYGELLTEDAVSLSVDPWMLIITLVLFIVVYCGIYVLWLKSFLHTVKVGPTALAEAAAKPVEEEIVVPAEVVEGVDEGKAEAKTEGKVQK